MANRTMLQYIMLGFRFRQNQIRYFVMIRVKGGTRPYPESGCFDMWMDLIENASVTSPFAKKRSPNQNTQPEEIGVEPEHSGVIFTDITPHPPLKRGASK